LERVMINLGLLSTARNSSHPRPPERKPIKQKNTLGVQVYR